MKSWLGTWAEICGDAGRLLAAHWPALLVICLLGEAGRYGFVWLAVAASDLNATLGVFLLPLAPLASLLSLILMLRVVAESLPGYRATWLGDSPAQRWRHHLSVAAGVLLPFIALYATLGMLRQDSRRYLQGITMEEFSFGLVPDVSRYEYASGWFLAALVLGALGLRKLIAAKELAKRSIAWGLAATYVEALWLMTLAVVLATELGKINTWVAERAIVDELIGRVEVFLGPLGAVWQGLVAWIGTVSVGVGEFVVVPMTWLAITAATYQSSFAVRAKLPSRPALLKRKRRLADWFQRLVLELLDPVIKPIKGLAGAFLRVAVVGAGPLLMMCFMFLALRQAQVGFAWLLWLLVGPQPVELRPMLAPYLSVATHVFCYVGLMVLLPATLHHLVSSGQRVQTRPAQEPATGSVT